jgi:hypothetical protein
MDLPPGRSCHTAIAAAVGHIEEGYQWVVDLDVEKFLPPSSSSAPDGAVVSPDIGQAIAGADREDAQRQGGDGRRCGGGNGARCAARWASVAVVEQHRA